MLVVNGVEYGLRAPKSEEELESLVAKHYKKSIGRFHYLSVKTQLKNLSGSASIPDV